jgi:hypothetical protein
MESSSARRVNITVRELFDVYTRPQDGEVLNMLRTPFGGKQNHPAAVRVNKGGDITEVNRDGTRQYKGTGCTRGRGVEIELDFDGEDGCLWTLALWFHKGDVYSEVFIRDHVSPFPAETVLWRDQR